MIGRLKFMARDHKENLIWIFIIRVWVEQKAEEEKERWEQQIKIY